MRGSCRGAAEVSGADQCAASGPGPGPGGEGGPKGGKGSVAGMRCDVCREPPESFERPRLVRR